LLIQEIQMAAAEAEKVVAPALPIPNFSDIGKAANDVSIYCWQVTVQSWMCALMLS
jgi:hypothetical protein